MVSDNQKTKQLNNAVVNVSIPRRTLKEFHAYVNAYLDEYEQWRDEYNTNKFITPHRPY